MAVVALHAGVDARAVTRLLRGDVAGGVILQEQCVSGVSDSFGLILPRFKQRFTFLSHSTGKYCLVVRKRLNGVCNESGFVFARLVFP